MSFRTDAGDVAHARQRPGALEDLVGIHFPVHAENRAQFELADVEGIRERILSLRLRCRSDCGGAGCGLGRGWRLGLGRRLLSWSRRGGREGSGRGRRRRPGSARRLGRRGGGSCQSVNAAIAACVHGDGAADFGSVENGEPGAFGAGRGKGRRLRGGLVRSRFERAGCRGCRRSLESESFRTAQPLGMGNPASGGSGSFTGLPKSAVSGIRAIVHHREWRILTGRHRERAGLALSRRRSPEPPKMANPDGFAAGLGSFRIFLGSCSC